MLDGVYTAREIHAEQKVFVRAEAGDAVFWPGHVRRIEENDPDKPFRCFAIFLRWPSAPLDLPRVVPDTDGIMRYLAMQLIAIKESRTPLPSAVANGFLSALLAEYLRRALSPPDPLEAKVLAFLSPSPHHTLYPRCVSPLCRPPTPPFRASFQEADRFFAHGLCSPETIGMGTHPDPRYSLTPLERGRRPCGHPERCRTAAPAPTLYWHGYSRPAQDLPRPWGAALAIPTAKRLISCPAATVIFLCSGPSRCSWVPTPPQRCPRLVPTA
jgi:hypothetical protein